MFISLLICNSLSVYTPSTTCPSNTNSYNSLTDNYCNDLKEGSTVKNTIDDGDNLLLSITHRYRCCRQGVAGDITISTDIPAEAFYGSTKIKNVALTSGVTSIGEYAFYGCTNLVLDLSFDSKLSSISENAFEGCISLSSNIKFSGGSIGNNAFKNCYGLKGSLTLNPNSNVNYQTIGESAFEGTHISSFTPGQKVYSIGKRAFYSTDITSALRFTNKLNSIGSEAFKNTPISGLVFVETESDYFTIGSHAFENTNINQAENLYIPDSCRSIGEYSFARIKFTGTVSLGDQIKTIPQYAFYNSTITRVMIPNGPVGNSFHQNLDSIGNHAFDNTKLDGAINFGDYIRTIGTYAFKSIPSLKGPINLPDSLQSIGKFAFYGCTGINGQIIPRNALTSIDDCAFENTGISGPLTIEKTLSIGKRTFAGTKLTELTIYNNIPESAFEGIDTLTILRVNLSSATTKTIAKNAFKDSKISSIMEFYSTTINTDAFYKAQFTNETSGATIFFKDTTISSYAFRSFQISKCLINLTDATINSHAFETMTGQPSVTFHHVVDIDDGDNDESNPTNDIGSYAFYNTEIQRDLDIPRFIRSIGSYAFAYCSRLTGNLDINATRISNYAFYNSGFIGSLSLGSQVELISAEYSGSRYEEADESFTFRRCNFNTLKLNNKNAIPNRAFYKMTSINTALTIPETVTSIGNEAFANCNIKSLTFESNQNSDSSTGANTLTIGTAAFMGCTEISNDLVINRALEDSSINSYAFHGCSGIKSLTFDTKLTSIDSYAFYGCKTLSSVSFPKEISSIGHYSFAECTRLTGNLNIYQATLIGNGAFQNCASLNGALDLGSVYYIGDGAFSGCTGFDQNLTVYNPTFTETLPSIPGIAIPYIGSSAFSGCTNLKGSLPLSNFKTIGSRAFYECSGLNGQLSFPGIDVEDYTFYRCSGLNGPLALRSDNIGKYAFYGCSGFSGEFKVPDEVESIGQYAFAGCSGLTGPLEFPSTTIYIGKGAFSGCKGFSDHLDINVGVDDSSTPVSNILRIEDRAFEDCSGFKNGNLNIYVENDELVDQKSSNYIPHYRYPYFLRIQNKAFDGTKFKNIYYNGRFQPDCDHDIGISSIKGIHTSSNYVNKSFCGNPVHKSKLSGGAIAGIVIACIVVVAAIVVLIVFLILRNKKNKDNSEGEVEMNNEP